MDDVVSQLVSYRSLILMVVVLIGTFFIRRIAELAFPKLKQAAPETALAVSYTNPWSVWWNQVILYAIPVILGAVLALSITDWTPEGMPQISKPGLALYGVLLGWFASFGYKVLRKAFKQKTGIDLPSFSNPPPPGSDDIVIVAQDSAKVVVNVAQKKDSAPPVVTATEGADVEVKREDLEKGDKA